MSLLKNAILFDDVQHSSSIVHLNGATKSYNVFSTIEIYLGENDKISIHSTYKGVYERKALLTKGSIQEAHLEKLRALGNSDILKLNAELSDLNNPAKISDISEDYIIIDFENSAEIDLNKLLNVFENHLIKSRYSML